MFRESILHPERKATANPPSSSSSGPLSTQSELGHLANIVTTLFDARVASGTRTPAADVFTPAPGDPPRTPPRQHSQLPDQLTSPVRPTPTKLSRFLSYAESELGIMNAPLLEWRLKDHGYGPDVLDAVSDDSLKELNISHGDVIRLKRGAPAWWNGPLAKRPRPDVAGDVSGGQEEDLKRVRFERRWHDGQTRLYGPRIRKVDGVPPVVDYEDWFFCEEAEEWMKIPEGYVAELCPDNADVGEDGLGM